MPIKFLPLGGGFWVFLEGGGGSANFIFMGVGIFPTLVSCWLNITRISWKKGKDPHPQDKIQHLDFTKDPRPLYYKTRPCVYFTTKLSVVRPFSVLSKDEIGP